MTEFRQGQCPKCGGEDIDYAAQASYGDEQIYYPAECKTCGCKFNEWYSMEWIESTPAE